MGDSLCPRGPVTLPTAALRLHGPDPVCFCSQLSQVVPSVWPVVSWSVFLSVCLSVCLMSASQLLWEEPPGCLRMSSSLRVSQSVCSWLPGGIPPPDKFSPFRLPTSLFPTLSVTFPAPPFPLTRRPRPQRAYPVPPPTLPPPPPQSLEGGAQVRGLVCCETHSGWIARPSGPRWGDPGLGSETSQPLPLLSLGSHQLSRAPAEMASSGVSRDKPGGLYRGPSKDSAPSVRAQGQGLWCVSAGLATSLLCTWPTVTQVSRA